MLGLEIGYRHFLFADCSHIGSHLLKYLVILQCIQLLKTRYLALLLTRNMLEQQPAIDDLIHRLIERNRSPFPFPALAGPLKDLAYPVRVIRSLMPRLPLRTNRPIDLGHFGQVSIHREMRMERERVIRIPVDLDCDTIHYLYLDPAAGIAVKANRVERVFSLHELVCLEGGQLPGLDTSNETLGKIELGSDQRTTPYNCGSFQEIPARHPFYSSIYMVIHFYLRNKCRQPLIRL